MVLSCAVFDCKFYSTDEERRSFFAFPTVNKYNLKGEQPQVKLATERCQKWVASINRKNLTVDRVKNLRVCSEHFLSGNKITSYKLIIK